MANNRDNRGDRDRMYDDRDEGNRWGDRSFHDRTEYQRSIDNGGMGQSGYAAGRGERDRALDPYRNQGYGSSGQREHQGVATDDRFTGRGGSSDYNPGAGYAPDRMGDRNQRPDSMGVSRGGYGRSESTRTDPRHRHEHNARGPQGDRGPRGDVRGYGHQFSGNEGYDTRFDADRGVDQGAPDHGYGGNRGYDQGTGGYGGYGNRGYDQGQGQGRGYQNDESSLGGYGGQSMHGDYARSTGETERGVWQTNMQNRGGQRGLHRGRGPQGWTRSDDRIKELVCEALTDDEHVDATGIDVEVKAGDVTLLGMVPDRQTKRLAEDVVERISGVKDVTNQLKVSADERMKYGRASQSGSSKTEGKAQATSESTESTAHTHASQNGSAKDDKKARA